MVWWLVGGVVLVGLVVLAAVCAPLPRRLVALRHAGERLRERVESAQSLQGSVAALAERTADLEASLARPLSAKRSKH